MPIHCHISMANSHIHSLYLCLIIFCISHHLASTLGESNNYIIRMDLSFMPKPFSANHNWYLSTLASALENSDLSTSFHSKLIYSYSHVMNGFSASLSVSELEALKRSPGFVSSIPDLPVRVDTTHSSQFIGLNSNSSGAWQVSNHGQDVIIGVVDTGVWPESPSFNDNGMSEIPSRWKGECVGDSEFNSSLCNKKLIGARFFNKGVIAKYPNVTKTIVNSARDSDGHGTHTSSIAAGNNVEGSSFFGYAPGTASGMAPQARVAIYKALWPEVSSVASDMIAAIDQAIMDGVDVLSLSFGLDRVPLYEDPVAIATFAALEKGVFVSTSAGNEGPGSGTLHNGIPWVLTVAAGNIDRGFGGVITLGNGVSIEGSALFPGNSSFSHLPIVFMNDCANLMELKKVGYKIVACEENNGSLPLQFKNVEQAKVAGGVFITNVTDLKLSTFPAVLLNPKNGETVKNYIKINTEPKVKLEFRKTILGKKPAPTVTFYSSRGPSPSCPFVLKPDIMAPGHFILAAWPQNVSAAMLGGDHQLFSNFNLMVGTSMSCPHAAGVAALLKGAHPEWSPAAIRSALITTSDTLDNTLEPIKDHAFRNNTVAATPLAMGAGHINPNKALNPGLIYDLKSEDYVNFLCALNYSMQHIKIITKSASYNCSSTNSSSLDFNYPSFIAFFNANDSNSDATTVQEFHRTVTNVGEEQSIYVASISTPIKGMKVSVKPDKLVFKMKNEKQSFMLAIEGPRLLKEEIVFGYLSWVHTGGKYIVKSPIVATSLSSEFVS